MDMINKLLEKEAEMVVPLRFFKVREKLSGAMWGGHLSLKLNDIVYGFKLWIHFKEERDLTEEEALNNMHLEFVHALNHKSKYAGIPGFETSGTHYEAYSHCITAPDKIYLHRGGWFGNEKLKNIMMEKRSELKVSSRNGFDKKDEDYLSDLGFEVLVNLI